MNALRCAIRRRSGPSDGGSATVEFVFLGILVLVPLLYLVLAGFEVQRSAFAVTQAAREAGRALGTAEDLASGEARANYAMRLALRDQGLDPDQAELRYGPVGGGCAATAGATLEPGADFEVCVVRIFRVPGVPSYFDGGNNSVTGRYVVHVDDFRSAG
jgi:Flp pilus assembly protein TadG